MYAQNARLNKAAMGPVLLFAFVGVLLLPCDGFSQKSPRSKKDRVGFGREFLRTLYPDLNGKGYAITVETSLAFDEGASVPKYLLLDIGTAPKFTTLECCVGGYAGGTLPAPALPSPPEMGPARAPAPSTTQLLPKRPRFWDAEGRVHPKQYLSTAFVFDDAGYMVRFSADGPAVGNRDVDNSIAELVRSNPEMTEQEIVASLKHSGVKCGPNDKNRFVRDFPMKELERFVGKMEIISVNFSPLAANRDNVATWPDWNVKILVTRGDGTKCVYEASFDRFKGDLLWVSEEPNPTKK